MLCFGRILTAAAILFAGAAAARAQGQPSPSPSPSPSASAEPKVSGDPVSMKVAYGKGESVSTTLKSRVDIEVKAKFGSGEHAMEVNSATVSETEIGYVSKFADVDDKGVLQKETREYTKAKTKTTSTTSFGDQEGKPNTRNEDLPVEGKTFDLSREEGGTTKVTGKGDAAKIGKKALNQQVMFESIDGWLPDHPVRAGEHWTVEPKKLKVQFESLVEKFKFKTFEGTFDCTLKEVAVVEGRRVARITMTFNVEGDVDIVATMKMQGGDDDEDEPKKKPQGEMSFRIRKGSGEVQFDLERSMALSNDLKGDLEIDITSEEEEGGGKIKGKGTIEAKTSWKREEGEKK